MQSKPFGRVSRRGLLGAGLAAGVAPALASCGSIGGSRGISFTYWGPTYYQEFTQQMIDAFTQDYPDYSVDPQPSEWSSYWDKLATQVAGGDTPDVINMDGKYVSDYGGRGVLADLNSVEGLDLSGLTDSDKQAGTWQGSLYAASTGSNAFTIFVNPEVFSDLNMDIPDDTTWTWTDVLMMAGEITRRTGYEITGMTGGGTYADFTIWARQYDEDLFSETGAGFSESTMIEYFYFWQDLMTTAGGLDAAAAVEDGSVSYEQQLFPNNKAGMFWSWSNQLGNARTATGREILMLRPPSQTGSLEDNELFEKASMFWSLSSSESRKEGSVELINFLLNDPKAAAIQMVNRGVPSSQAVLDAMEDNLSDTDKYVVDFIQTIHQEITRPAPMVQPQGGSEAQNSISRALEDVRFQRINPREAGARVKQEIDDMVQAAN